MTEPVSDLAAAYVALRSSMVDHARAVAEAERIRHGTEAQLEAIAAAAYATGEITTVLGAIRALYWQWPDVPTHRVADAFGVSRTSMSALAGGLLSGRHCVNCGAPTWFLSRTGAKGNGECTRCNVQVYKIGQINPVRRGHRLAGLERISYRMRWPMSDQVESVWRSATHGAP